MTIYSYIDSRHDELCRCPNCRPDPDTRPMCANEVCPLASTLFDPNGELCAYCAQRAAEMTYEIDVNLQCVHGREALDFCQQCETYLDALAFECQNSVAGHAWGDAGSQFTPDTGVEAWECAHCSSENSIIWY